MQDSVWTVKRHLAHSDGPQPQGESSAVFAGILENPLTLDSPGQEKRSWRSESPVVRMLIVVVVAMAALFTTWSLRLLLAPSENLDARETLLEQVTHSQTRVESQAQEIATLQAQIAELEDSGNSLLTASEQGYFRQLSVISASSTVEGPGLVVTLSDAPDAGNSRSAEGRVQDADLQIVVDALWAGGAEGIAVNGYRLGASSAIRAAGQAVLVDLQPISSPYTIEAIGDAEILSQSVSSGTAGDLLLNLSHSYDINSDMQTEDRLVLLPTINTDLRYVERVD